MAFARNRDVSIGAPAGQPGIAGVADGSSLDDSFGPGGTASIAGSPVARVERLAFDDTLPVVRLRGVELHAITERQCIDHILAALAHGHGGTVVTPNLDIVRRCTQNLGFATLVSEADLVVPDGKPLIWASKLAGTPLKERIAGSDLIVSLTAAAADAGRSVFLLGGKPGMADAAAVVLKQTSPHLKVTGTYCPPMGFEKDPAEMDRIIAALVAAKPDVVWVGLGSPKQENLVNHIRDVLPKAWWLGVGISFSFLAGDVSRAPKWVQRIGLEWVHRLKQEPRRLAKRYLMDGLPFCATLLAGAAWQRISGGKPAVGRQYRGRRQRRPGESVAAEGVDMARPTAASVGTPVAPSVVVRHGNGSARGLRRLKAVILLGGKVRQTSLGSALDRSVLDLPLSTEQSILTHWVRSCEAMARRVGIENLAVRVMVDQKAHEPTGIDPAYAHMVRVERDQSSFRGTGGLLADIAAGYEDEDLILVANASQILLDPLSAIAQALDHKTGDFTLISHRDGTASGIMLLACKTVRSINPVGFIDLKEQALPQIARSHDVRVVHCRQPTGLPLFSLADYVGALQQYHRRRGSRRARTNPLGEDFARHFAIVEPGAEVAPGAYLHDAVVLRGAVVEPGAAAIRSLVLPGAVLRGEVSDRLVGA